VVTHKLEASSRRHRMIILCKLLLQRQPCRLEALGRVQERGLNVEPENPLLCRNRGEGHKQVAECTKNALSVPCGGCRYLAPRTVPNVPQVSDER